MLFLEQEPYLVFTSAMSEHSTVSLQRLFHCSKMQFADLEFVSESMWKGLSLEIVKVSRVFLHLSQYYENSNLFTEYGTRRLLHLGWI